MKKSITIAAISSILFAFVSCASGTVAAVDTSINGQDISVTSLNRSDYTILGYVSGEGSVIASDKVIAKERLGIRPVKRLQLENDTFRYGFTGTEHPAIMTVQETAIANAMYKMIKQAESNGADSVAFIQTRVSIIPKISSSGHQDYFNPESTVTAKVTGIAIKIKSETPSLQLAPVSECEDLDPAATFKYEKANSEKTMREKAEADKAARIQAIKDQKAKEAADAAATAATEDSTAEATADTAESADKTASATDASADADKSTAANTKTTTGSTSSEIKKQGAAQ